MFNLVRCSGAALTTTVSRAFCLVALGDDGSIFFLFQNCAFFNTCRKCRCQSKNSGSYEKAILRVTKNKMKHLHLAKCNCLPKSTRVFLPPANEVWSKVMFSQMFVCPQRGVGFPACITGHMTRGACIQGALRRPPGILQDTVNEPVVHILLECILAKVIGIQVCIMVEPGTLKP